MCKLGEGARLGKARGSRGRCEAGEHAKQGNVRSTSRRRCEAAKVRKRAGQD